jgi:hypothetical protein
MQDSFMIALLGLGSSRHPRKFSQLVAVWTKSFRDQWKAFGGDRAAGDVDSLGDYQKFSSVKYGSVRGVAGNGYPYRQGPSVVN